MDTVVVTGGRGGAGQWIVNHLAEQGWHVVCLDLSRPNGDPGLSNVEFHAVDLTNQGETWESISAAGPKAVVHFAAIPTNGIRPGTTTFTDNVTSTYNVLTAAGRENAKVVWASSESALGIFFAHKTWLPDYFPIDEEHPLRPEDPYGTSKVVGEEIAKRTVRRYGVPVASIRPSWINYPGEYNRIQERRANFDPQTAERSGNFWSYVDVRDVVKMVKLALEADFEGHEAFFAVAAENYIDRPTKSVIEAVFGDLPEECDLKDDECVTSTAKAKKMLGWEPSHSWREAEGETVESPSFGH